MSKGTTMCWWQPLVGLCNNFSMVKGTTAAAVAPATAGVAAGAAAAAACSMTVAAATAGVAAGAATGSTAATNIGSVSGSVSGRSCVASAGVVHAFAAVANVAISWHLITSCLICPPRACFEAKVEPQREQV